MAASLKAGDRLPAWLPILLGFLQAVGPLSTDMYLPAFPAIEASLHAAAGTAQITLGSWIVGLALGQLVQGALSDRFGRRGPLVAGTLIYTVGAVGCALAPSIAVLSAWRLLAAFGASASMVIPRAIVRDVTQGRDSARLMSRLILVLGAAPILAPTLGGLVLQWASWRAIFWITAGYGLVALGCAWLRLPDTLPVAARVPIHPVTMLRRYAHILTERGFLTHALMMSFYAFSLFAYLGGSPTVFIEHYHYTPGQFALVFGAIAATFITASQLNMRVIQRFDLDGTLRRASTLYLVLAACVMLLALRDAPGPLLGLFLALTQGLTGFLNPTATVGALRHHGAHAGSASALLGTMIFGIGATSGFLVGWLTDGTAVPMAGLMLAGAVAAKVADLARKERKFFFEKKNQKTFVSADADLNG
jgi:DHA1 family bicyclomycin/chloramphenicol resistance-like MFS transporter